jgi:endoglucanase
MRGLCSLALSLVLGGCIPDTPSGIVVRRPGGAPSVTSLRRGINCGNALDAPSEGAWGVVLEPAFFDAVRAAGFDHVRIPVRFSGHAGDAAPYTIDEAFFQRVDWAVNQVLSRGMTPIVDMHHYGELMDHPAEHAARFLGLWTQIVKRYVTMPPSLVYELVNEPTGQMTAERWNALVVRALQVVRAVDSSHTVVVDSVFWAAAKELQNLVLPADEHLVASFHMYQPILFTHQGMKWMPAEYGTLGVVFPGPPKTAVDPVASAQRVDWVRDWFTKYNTMPVETNPGGLSAIAHEFEMADAFVQRTHVPLYMGEFGTGDRADMASRVAWTRAVRKEAERRGIGWAYWDNGGAFKIYEKSDRSRPWNPDLYSALLLE